MKRLFLLLIVLCAGISAMAQDWQDKVVHSKYDIRVSIGGPNALYLYPSKEFGSTNQNYGYWKSDLKLSDIYDPYYEIYSTPTFTAEFNYHTGKRVFVGGDFSWNRTWGHQIDPVTEAKIKDKDFSSFHLMGMAAIYWIQVPHFKLYSSIYAGAELRSCDIDGDVTTKVKPAFDVNIGGAEWAGDVVFGFAEVLFGTRMNIIKIGVGFRF